MDVRRDRRELIEAVKRGLEELYPELEIVDEESKIAAFQQTLSELFEQADCGGLVPLENIRVVHYVPEKGR